MNAIEQLKQKPILIGGIIAGTFVSVGLLAWGISQSMPVKSQPATQTAPQPSKQIVALGRLEPAGGIVKLSAPLALDGDRVKELRAEEGSKIRAGQIIAVLDSVDRLQATLIHERQQVAVAQSKLAQIKAGAKSGEIAAQQATISRTQIQLEGDKSAQQEAIGRIKAQWEGDRAAQLETIGRIKAQWEGDRAAQSATIGKFQVELSNARSELNRYQQLATQGAISQSLLDSKKLAVSSFEQQLREAEAIRTRIENTSSKQLKEAQTVLARIQSTNRKQLQEAEVILVKIQGTGKGQIVEAQANLIRIAEIRPVDIQAVQAEVKSAIAAQNRAQTELERAYIRTPTAGEILKINTRMGEKVTDKGIVDLAQTEATIVVAEVYQTDIDRVKLGQKATITSQAFSGELSGVVDRIGLQVNRQNVFSDRPGENLDRRIIEVKIKLDSNDSKRVSSLTNLQVQATIHK
ncbi:efflux RND transporter periplasmic adaptor subunit [Chamaesiphon sp. VAR_48_metabat_135_sub]|uniref:efflux RND transporter periplasmic adaptor subunit n=1 Tax=Chamaesiphon sp. VAR_48_metabat_135_sub TaxID=2964699 RepID=UPI00286B23A7|nr:efflux RND transporter periplasmic adaptor subunit [Chamaesiphon sp. VAR_48_metabat_135_sub]